ncbi:MBD3 protein [Aphelenchoides besseyi]|nr:MBD3 protein [Aphelenchoides besseyi]KAI6207595.1 MBD3 protein [Aphelenchoides besseyi]
MGRTKFSEAGPKRSNRNQKSTAALAAKNGFDGLTEAPWRKTPSIFKQPVTLVHTTSKSTQKMPEAEVKKFNQVQRSRSRLDKPKQIFWSKRLEGLRAMVPVHSHAGGYCPIDEEEYIEQKLTLASKIENTVSCLAEEASAASFCAALHLSNGLPIIGQTATRKQIDQKVSLTANFSQPFVQVPLITEQDITQQERRIIDARKRLSQLRETFAR